MHPSILPNLRARTDHRGKMPLLQPIIRFSRASIPATSHPSYLPSFPPSIFPFFHPFVLALTTNHCLLLLAVVELGERENEAVYGGDMRGEREDAEYDDENGAVVSPGEVLGEVFDDYALCQDA